MTSKVDFVLSGSCWWDLPIDAPLEREPLRQYNQTLARDTPVTFAKLLGVPVIHANHCGKIAAFNFPNADKIQTRQLVGATQIVDGNGHVLERKDFSEGAGFVISDIPRETAYRNRVNISNSKYWIPDLPDSYIHAWETVNPKAKKHYESVTLPYYRKAVANEQI